MEPFTEDNEVPLVKINMISNTLAATPAKLDEIGDYASQDPVLSHLNNVLTKTDASGQDPFPCISGVSTHGC